VPADDPRLAMIVLLDEPKNEKWGSEAAAPIFAAIGREALRYLNVAPRDSSPVPIVRAELARATPERARPAASAEGPALDAVALPAGAADAASASAAQPAPPDGVMPRLGGLSLRQAMETLAPHGVRLEITGRGVVTSQLPLPGAPLPPGTVCRLHLAPTAGRPSAALAVSFPQ
jgi:cell division protein FtsI (penicillin-binding protein 3)